MVDPQTLLHQLADLPPGDLPVLSIYLDLRPAAGGTHPGLPILERRLRAIAKTFAPRGPELASFRADAARLKTYLTCDFGPAVRGMALFACAGRDIFEEVGASLPFEDLVAVGPTPDLFPLAWLIDGLETALVVLVDTSSARLFIARRGLLQASGGFTAGPRYYGKREVGGWSQAHAQRHDDGARALVARQFPRQIAAELDRLVARTGATRVILAGDAAVIPHLQEVLSPRVAGLVAHQIVHLDTRASSGAISDAIDPLLTTLEATGALAFADRLIGAIRADGLGVAGWRATRAALARGQVATLLLDPAKLVEEERAELVRLAARADSAVEMVTGHEAFGRLGGVGALLRYRLDWPPSVATIIHNDRALARLHSAT